MKNKYKKMPTKRNFTKINNVIAFKLKFKIKKIVYKNYK